MIVPIIKRCYQKNIDKATEELLADCLKNITESPEVNLAVEHYRELKHRMAEAETTEAKERLVEEIASTQEFKGWLRGELAKDNRRSKKRIPEDMDKRVSLYIASLKSGLPAVIPTAVFTESKDRWGRTGLWRVQSNGYLTGLAVLDLDHVKDVGAKVDEWLQRKDFGELGILWIFITASGEGVKVVFKAREEWGNLIDNAYQARTAITATSCPGAATSATSIGRGSSATRTPPMSSATAPPTARATPSPLSPDGKSWSGSAKQPVRRASFRRRCLPLLPPHRRR